MNLLYLVVTDARVREDPDTLWILEACDLMTQELTDRQLRP